MEITRGSNPARLQKRKDAKSGMSNLPGWATWTAAEMADWIDANVTDLASAKACLKKMARAICYLRDHSLIVE